MRCLVVLLLLLPGTPAVSQPADEEIVATPFDLASFPVPPLLAPKEPIVVPQFRERYERDGTKVRQRGILVGKDIGRNMTVGLGFADRKPRKSALSPVLSEEGQRRSGKASMLFRYKF